MHEMVKYTASKIKTKQPVHLLGIGDPIDIWNLVKYGIDTFDCVSPTRLARHGSALSRNQNGKINIKNASYKNDLLRLEETCNCLTCNNYSKAYLHHLFKTNELLGFQLLTIHNVYFMNSLMIFIRNAINNDMLEEAEKKWYLT